MSGRPATFKGWEGSSVEEGFQAMPGEHGRGMAWHGMVLVWGKGKRKCGKGKRKWGMDERAFGLLHERVARIQG